MAEGVPTFPGPQSEFEKLKEELQCTVCLDVFKKPVMILPCLHSFCSCCLETLVHSSSSSSSSSLPPSPSFESLSDDEEDEEVGKKRSRRDEDKEDSQQPPSKQQKVGWSSSSSSSSSSFFHPCPVCRRSFSLSQASENLVVHSLLDRLASLSSLLDPDSSDPSPLPLPSSSLSISPESQEKRDRLSVLVESVEDRHKDIDRSLSLIDQMETKIQETMITEKERIGLVFEEMTRSIENRKLVLLQELNDLSTHKLEKLSQQRKQLERDKECLDNSVKVSRSFLKNASDDQLSFHLPLLSDQLTRLMKDKDLLKKPSVSTCPRLIIHKEIDMNPLVNGGRFKEARPPDLQPALRLLSPPIKYSTLSLPKRSIPVNPKALSMIGDANSLAIDQSNNVVVCQSSKSLVQVFDQEGNELLSLGRACFDHPKGIAIDKNNNFIICDTRNKMVTIFDDRGNFVRSFGSVGSRDGQFKIPEGVAVDNNNRIIVCDTFNHRVQIFDEEGNHIKSFGSEGEGDGQFNTPRGVIVDHNNRIIVNDTANDRIQVFDDEGHHILSFITNEDDEDVDDECDVRTLAVDHHNNILACDRGNNRILVFDPEGHRIAIIGPDGKGSSSLKKPQGVSVDHDNNIIVLDRDDVRVQIF